MKKKLFGLFAVIAVVVFFTFVGCETGEFSEIVSSEPYTSTAVRTEASEPIETMEETTESFVVDVETGEFSEIVSSEPYTSTAVRTEASEPIETNTDAKAETTEETTEEATESFVVDVETFEPGATLVYSLQEYLEWQNMEFDVPDTRLERKIKSMVYGSKTVLMSFDPEDFYYVCAYFDGAHCSEKINYCCKNDYTWIGFCSNEFIPEKYEGKELIAAFQINRAGQGESIFEDFDEPCFESIKQYYPTFEQGKNTADSMYFDNSYLYVCANYEINKETIYVYSGYMAFFEAIYCVKLDGKIYIVIGDCPEKEASEERLEELLREELGEYYDDLSQMVINDKYSRVDHWGNKYKCVVIDLDDFAFCLSNERAKE